jgi:glc operon protein GlcG
MIAALALLLAAPAVQTARPMLDYASAAAIRDGCFAWARQRRLAVSIAVFDDAGRLITFARMDGATNSSGDVAQWKARSAAGYRIATAETAKWGGFAPQIAVWEGGQPLFAKDGTALGGVGVSGAQSAEDIECGKVGIAAAGLSITKP